MSDKRLTRAEAEKVLHARFDKPGSAGLLTAAETLDALAK